MATSKNRFELLQDDEPVEAVVPKTAQKPTTAKPTKPTTQKKSKPVEKNLKAPVVKGSFEEEPVHKEKTVTAGTEEHQKKRQFDRKSNNPDKRLSQKKSTGKGSWGNEQDTTAEPVVYTAEEEE
jgi:hypothetical protein